MTQIGRNVTDVEDGCLRGTRHLILDRDTKYTDEFRKVLVREGIHLIRLPPRSPNFEGHPGLRLILFDGAHQTELADLILEATRRIVADREMAADNAKWFRFTARDVERGRDGLTLGANVPSHAIKSKEDKSHEHESQRINVLLRP
jgi:hypothetical protein